MLMLVHCIVGSVNSCNFIMNISLWLEVQFAEYVNVELDVMD